jgi:hypothetical protein
MCGCERSVGTSAGWRASIVDLLEREPAVGLHEIDQAEVSRAEHHGVAARHVVLLALGGL